MCIRDRYETVLEASRSGKLTTREVRFDELYSLVSEINTAVGRIQTTTQRIKNRIWKN